MLIQYINENFCFKTYLCCYCYHVDYYQELEDQERINALVEQEVRRRILEERLERERTWVTKRKQERQERDNEMSRIRKSHQREMHRLKEKYEGKSVVIWFTF